MKVGDLIKIYPKDGAASFEMGVYLGEEKCSQFDMWVKKSVFLVNGQKRTYCKIDYFFEVINESR
tara:strand:+ start:373 stop:567 length:195 start_codon:yes stop_codon:yes gene_type:complete